jgi:hypothetical protein
MASPFDELLVSLEKSWRVLSEIDYLAEGLTSLVDDIIEEFN